MQLWQERDDDPVGARFDPGQDVLLRTLTPGAPLRFEALAAPLPPGGRRFYVTVDIASNPSDARTLQLRVPPAGVEVASGNDGPIDVAVESPTIHRTSTGVLLVTTTVQPLQTSRGAGVEVRLAARNRGSVQLDGVLPLQLLTAPPIAFGVESGPLPANLSLAPGAVDTLRLRLHFDAAGTTQLTAIVGTADSSVVAPPATSSSIAIQEPPSGVVLAMQSSMPALVNRGQTDVVPLVWKLSHPDADPTAAAIAIRRLTVRVEDQGGNPQPATAVLASYAVLDGATIRGGSQSPPANADVGIDLAPPILLQPGDERSLSLRIAVAAAATATSFRLRLVDATTVSAVDANSGLAIGVAGTFPWASQAAALRTPAPYVDGNVAGLLPARANRGQSDVPVGSIAFSVPGAPARAKYA
jgi:hypothetical protein